MSEARPAPAPILELDFPHTWVARVLAARPAIVPARNFVYPAQAEEVERGALEVLIHPGPGEQAFLASCALGFRDPAVPSGIWSCPNSKEICAVSGGYAYIISTTAPERFTMISFRPVLRVLPVLEQRLLLFIGHHRILGWGTEGQAWETTKLSDEGLNIDRIEGSRLHGRGWSMLSDKETPFTLDLGTGGVC